MATTYEETEKKVYDLSPLLREQQRQQTEAALADLKNAYTKNMAQYNAAEKQLPQIYDANRNAAAAQDAIARKNFQERAVDTGLNTGTSGQAELARQSAYRKALAGIDSDEAKARADLDLARQNLTADYQAAMAKARASGDANLLGSLYSEMTRVQNLDRADAQQAAAAQQSAADAAYKQQQTAAETAYKQQLDSAKALANVGDYSAYGSLFGWTPEQIAAAQTQYAAQNAPKTAATSGTAGTTGATAATGTAVGTAAQPTGTASGAASIGETQAVLNAQNGIFDEPTLNALHDMGFSDADLMERYGYEPMPASQMPGAPVGQLTPGVRAANWLQSNVFAPVQDYLSALTAPAVEQPTSQNGSDTYTGNGTASVSIGDEAQTPEPSAMDVILSALRQGYNANSVYAFAQDALSNGLLTPQEYQTAIAALSNTRR